MKRTAWTFNVAVDFWRHPKAVRAGRDGRDLFLCALGWTGDYKLDGRLPTEAIEVLAGQVGIPLAAARKAARRLVAVELWETVEDGWIVHDYLDWQPSAAEREAKAQGNAERQQRYKQSRKKPPRPPQGNALPDALPTPLETRSTEYRDLVPTSDLLESSSSTGASDDDDRVAADPRVADAIRLLAERDTAQAVTDGVKVRNQPSYVDGCAKKRWLSDGRLVALVAADHPDWTPDQLAAARLGVAPTAAATPLPAGWECPICHSHGMPHSPQNCPLADDETSAQ